MIIDRIVFRKDRATDTLNYDPNGEYPIYLLANDEDLFQYCEEFKIQIGLCKIIDHTITQLPSIGNSQSQYELFEEYINRYRHTIAIEIIDLYVDEVKAFVNCIEIKDNCIMHFTLYNAE